MKITDLKILHISTLLEGPGWGVDLREDVLARYPPVPCTPVASEPYQEFF